MIHSWHNSAQLCCNYFWLCQLHSQVLWGLGNLLSRFFVPNQLNSIAPILFSICWPLSRNTRKWLSGTRPPLSPHCELWCENCLNQLELGSIVQQAFPIILASIPVHLLPICMHAVDNRSSTLSRSYREFPYRICLSQLEEDQGIGILLIAFSLLVDCKFQNLCQEDKINDR